MMSHKAPPLTPTVHLGAPVHLAGLTVFPAWTDQATPRRALSTTPPERATITEIPDQPQVDKLLLENPSKVAFLVLEGLLVTGGWQHRVLTHSWLIGPQADYVLDVRCVEQGRWNGNATHGFDRRRAPLSIRGALRSHDGPPSRRVAQGDVWSRVHDYESRHGTSPTSSLVEVMDTIPTLPDDRPLPAALPGQRGVLIGIAGHPVLLELFDHPMTLAKQLPALLEGLLVDGIRQPWVPTTGRRARAFAHAASHRPLQAVQEAGIGVVAETRDTLVDIHGLLDHRNRLVHTAVVNVRHQLIAA